MEPARPDTATTRSHHPAAPYRGDAATVPPPAARRIVAALNATVPPTARQPLPGELLALSLLHEAAHLAIEEAERREPDVGIAAALPTVREAVGARPTATLLRTFAREFPGIDEDAAARLEDLLLVHLANVNPAARPLQALVDESGLPKRSLADALRATSLVDAVTSGRNAPG